IPLCIGHSALVARRPRGQRYTSTNCLSSIFRLGLRANRGVTSSSNKSDRQYSALVHGNLPLPRPSRELLKVSRGARSRLATSRVTIRLSICSLHCRERIELSTIVMGQSCDTSIDDSAGAHPRLAAR